MTGSIKLFHRVFNECEVVIIKRLIFPTQLEFDRMNEHVLNTLPQQMTDQILHLA